MNYLDKSPYEYSRTDFYPFHMPGHKRQVQMNGQQPYAVDITEIATLTIWHHAEGI